MSDVIFPGKDWERVSPAEVGFDPARLAVIQGWLDEQVEAHPEGDDTGPSGYGRKYRVVIVRGGRIAAEWNRGFGPEALVQLASATKSIFSCALGIAIDQGQIGSADDPVTDYYPEAMDVPPGAGPKPGRHVFPENHAITLRQLICNTSGYMKPGEAPGQVFHYQTYGMNILTHAIAKTYGLYSPDDPEGSPRLRVLVDRWLRDPIGASWDYYQQNFLLPASARIHVFGYYDGVQSTALDMARLGWLWRHEGRWEDRQLIPAEWLRAATVVAPDIRANCPAEQWQYGHGFWTNQAGRLWPSLPRDSYAASGAGSQHIWVCPGLDLVVAQSPGVWADQAENDSGLLRRVVDALVDG